MDAQKLFLIKSQFVFMSRKMVFFIRVLWVSFFTLFDFIGRPVFRLHEKFVIRKRVDVTEEEESESLLRFRFPTFEEFVRNNDLHLVSHEVLCGNSDDKFPLVENKREILCSQIGMVAKLVEEIAVPQMNSGSKSDMIAKPVEETAVPQMNSERISDMIVKPVEEVALPLMDLENVSDMIAKRVEEIAVTQMNSGSKSDMIAKPFERASPVRYVIGNVENKVCDAGKIAKNSQKVSSEMDVSRKEVSSVPVHCLETILEEIDVENDEEPRQVMNNSMKSLHVLKQRNQILSDDEPLVSDSDSDSMGASRESSFRSSFMDSPSDGFLSDIDFERAFDFDCWTEYGCKEVKLDSEFLTEEDIELRNLSKGYGSDDLDEDEDSEILQEYKDLKADIEDDTDTFDTEVGTYVESESLSELSSERQSSLSSEKQNLVANLVDQTDTFDTESITNVESESPNEQISEKQPFTSSDVEGLKANIVDVSDTFDTEHKTNVESELLGEQKPELQNSEPNSGDCKDTLDEEDETKMESGSEGKQNSEKSSSGEQQSSDSDDQNGLEREWEHQDLVEQLKMEIKKVRAIGLPTILEESESPKIMDDLKPWKIEEKYQHEGTMDELHKFYKSYRERMRKLDILNFQKMYAIGFLRLKDPLKSFTRNRISTPALAAIVSIDCWPCKPKSSSEVHQPVMKKFTRELESDLEMVYVGQMCLSWEFLCWEYGKALDLWESDPHGMRRYNEVADKFQTFQVLLTRFLEDEPFQGPRVHHYAKNRCVLRNLLQVPVVRDDNYRDRQRKETKVVSSKDSITSLQLLETIEETIRVLWQFIRTDKDTSNAVLVNCRRSSNVELQNPADASLLADLRSTLHKKDKKLRELTRSENCVLRNLKRNKEEGADNVLYFFSRVDLKLVSRVLNMSKLRTEQLVWCSDKLNKINFVGRKLNVEPSILLFPCSY